MTTVEVSICYSVSYDPPGAQVRVQAANWLAVTAFQVIVTVRKHRTHHVVKWSRVIEEHQEWLWGIARRFSQLRRIVKRTTGIRLKGLGFILRHLRHDHEFDALGFRWYLDHRIAGPYASLLTGSYNEPETHAFLQHVASSVGSPFVFVNVGANIGEVAIPMAAHPKCRAVIAFEPHPICVEVLAKQNALNGIVKMDVRAKLVGDGTPRPYWINTDSSPESGIRHDIEGVPLTPTTTLDQEFDMDEAWIMLIDVEGAELDVMKGARTIITEKRPLIIFEYHEGTRKHFSLEDVLGVIGTDYQLFRLREDGRLDEHLSDMWNCVAVHPESVLRGVIQNRLN